MQNVTQKLNIPYRVDRIDRHQNTIADYLWCSVLGGSKLKRNVKLDLILQDFLALLWHILEKKQIYRIASFRQVSLKILTRNVAYL